MFRVYTQREGVNPKLPVVPDRVRKVQYQDWYSGTLVYGPVWGET